MSDIPATDLNDDWMHDEIGDGEFDIEVFDDVLIDDTPVGKGIFALRDYPTAVVVGEIVGDVIEDENYRSDYCFDLDNGTQLEPYEPLWVEEPTTPENPADMAEVARYTSIPVATGERLCTKHEFARVLETGAASLAVRRPGRSGSSRPISAGPCSTASTAGSA